MSTSVCLAAGGGLRKMCAAQQARGIVQFEQSAPERHWCREDFASQLESSWPDKMQCSPRIEFEFVRTTDSDSRCQGLN